MLVFDIPSMNTRREKCPYSELFWSIFSRIRTKYREILSIFPYVVRMRENTDENNSEYRHFLHCDTEAVAQRWSLKKLLWKISPSFQEHMRQVFYRKSHARYFFKSDSETST